MHINHQKVCKQNHGSSAYTQHWVLYTWNELIMSISQIAQEADLVEEVEDSSNSGKIYMTGQPKGPCTKFNV